MSPEYMILSPALAHISLYLTHVPVSFSQWATCSCKFRESSNDVTQPLPIPLPESAVSVKRGQGKTSSVGRWGVGLQRREDYRQRDEQIGWSERTSDLESRPLSCNLGSSTTKHWQVTWFSFPTVYRSYS